MSRTVRGAAWLTALALVPAAALSRMLGILCSTAVVIVLAVMIARARREEPALRPTRTWMLLALFAGIASGVGAIVDQILRPTAGYPRVGDIIELLYVPCTLTALMLVPLKGGRRGFRARAFSDGLVAATSLLYLLEPALSDVAGAHHHWTANTVALALPLGGVVIVSGALTTYARCTDEARPMLRWLALGISMMAAADLLFAVSPTTEPGFRRSLFQLGVTTLIGAALRRPSSAGVRSSHEEVARALAVLPYLPFGGTIALSTVLVVRGQGLNPAQLVLAIAVGLALVVRQAAGGRDKTRLVDELERREARLQHELRVDPLTGVANRLGLEEAVAAGLGDPSRHFGVVLLDLDDFKLVNDNHGHAVGDEVLREVARRLQACVRERDVVARLGGDEFAVFLNGPTHVLATVSQRLVEALAAPVMVDERRFRMSASIGLVGKEDGDTVEQLLADADGAMYEAKSNRGTSSLVSLDRQGRQDVAWRSLIREQVAHPVLEQFDVHYQPVVDLSTGALRGFEALLRWNHPASGPVPPDVFIPLAEQCGSITVLGDFVLQTAVRDLAALSWLVPDQRLAVGVNVSPRQLASHGFAAHVTRSLAAAGLAPDQLVVEITEQAFDADVDSMQQNVRRLVAEGVSVAVDDFGTGYSSLRYLQHLDLDVLKIDRTFVSGIGADGQQERLLEGIAALAQRMTLQIVAEGIETKEQLALLRGFGCDLGQGYLFSRPVPLAELVRLVERGHRYDVHGLAPVPAPRTTTELLTSEPTA